MSEYWGKSYHKMVNISTAETLCCHDNPCNWVNPEDWWLILPFPDVKGQLPILSLIIIPCQYLKHWDIFRPMRRFREVDAVQTVRKLRFVVIVINDLDHDLGLIGEIRASIVWHCHLKRDKSKSLSIFHKRLIIQWIMDCFQWPWLKQ